MTDASRSSSSDPKVMYGEELRVRREAAGLTQLALGEAVILSPSMIAHIEAGRRKPRPEDAKRLDKALCTDGFFARFLPTLDGRRYAEHFNQAADAETRAVAICSYAVSLVPGIFQTEHYARAVFRAQYANYVPEEVDKLVVNRLARAQILRTPGGPTAWTILNENVLRAVVGGPAVMAAQLRHIAELGRSGRVFVQVIPHAAGAHATMTSMMSLMRFEDEPDAAYVEGLYTGAFVDDPAMVRAYRDAYDLAKAAGLPPEASLGMIESVAKEYDLHDLSAHP
ncbi:helix-turn-helix domain-containing protein [Actinacidiphila bryophytorum]|uniref:helix-turn-helix domain-containing protein n=1 Tax=Actinacidiphila bryophytorum TaxID=1436133 RepID=UPI002176CDED|nr:helix-turn-helix transcriptional regulator [Actinacidiphila bryophytorum]UWE11552.1 helix-turn-helix transcriptional regulator [Actinacidiphila bryophytorum]